MTSDRSPLTFACTPLDRRFADFICRLAGTESPRLLRLLSSLVSSAVSNGHVCLHLAAIAGKRVVVDGAEELLPPLEQLRQALAATGVAGEPGAFMPLVIDSVGRLYLHRYWQYERDLAEAVTARADASCAVDERLLEDGLARLFPPRGGDGVDWQKVAAVAALRKRFCVISGGPGTGKTSTVVKIIALLAEQEGESPLRIALAAPTGKAAARLRESVYALKETLACSDSVRALIPEGVSTLHRLLGARGTSVRFRHSAENLLPWDAVIVDEASMVALPLMAKLTAALRPRARLILLGDRDQLASVEAGAVLGDICGRGRSERFSSSFADLLARVAGEQLPPDLIEGERLPRSRLPTPRSPVPRHESRDTVHEPIFPGPQSPVPGPSLTDSLVILKRNYRFGADSVIGAAARETNAGEGGQALGLLRERGWWSDVPPAGQLKGALEGRVVAGFEAYLRAESPEEALRRFDDFRVLCALRQGPWGVVAVNTLIEEILAGHSLIERSDRWYRGRPVMVTVNDAAQRLFNGDVGIVIADSGADGSPRVCFPRPEGGVRTVSPLRLPPHETVFAMTVHKSQGSEFDRVLLLLPPHETAPLTRELIYTGLTRARREAELWGDASVFLQAVSRRTERDSGLEDLLWPITTHGDLTN